MEGENTAFDYIRQNIFLSIPYNHVISHTGSRRSIRHIFLSD
ncbi:MAG: hypothetical protein RIT37_1238 [Bacteroidota bacterium]|jgi:hypothetical protein